MRFAKRSYLGWGIAAVAVTAAVVDIEPKPGKQTFAPQELNASAGPAPIVRDTPAVPKGSTNFESAEEARLRVVVLTKGLQQPWSMAFLPDGTMLVTERIGRLRLVRNGKLASTSVAGVPTVQGGGPRGIQGLMDIALHPNFDRNKWVYLAYHKPVRRDLGETVLARGTWNGSALVDVHTIFESGATDTRSIAHYVWAGWTVVYEHQCPWIAHGSPIAGSK